MNFTPILPISPATARGFASPLLAQTLQPESSARGPTDFFAAHWEAFAIGVGLVAAGIGTGVLLWKRRGTEKGGGSITETQRKARESALQFEKNLSSADGRVRRESILALINLLLKLSPEDRAERIRRIAGQLCVDWPAINKDSQIGLEIKNRIPRLLRPLLEQLTAELERRTREPASANIQANAEAILKWIRGK